MNESRTVSSRLKIHQFADDSRGVIAFSPSYNLIAIVYKKGISSFSQHSANRSATWDDLVQLATNLRAKTPGPLKMSVPEVLEPSVVGE